MSQDKQTIFERKMNGALRSWHAKGQDTTEAGIADMPFDDLLRFDGEAIDDGVKQQRIAIHEQWMALQAVATDLAERKLPYTVAQERADAFYDKHAADIAAFTNPTEQDECGDYEWKQRAIGARIVFRWILAEGFFPPKIMKRLFAVGRALMLEPFMRMTMTEQGLMFGETKAACSWRMKLLSGLIKLTRMAGHRLPGQKTERASEAAREVAKGNKHRANSVRGHRPRQGSFLRRLHVKTQKAKPDVS